jgi:hypothetical protein
VAQIILQKRLKNPLQLIPTAQQNRPEFEVKADKKRRGYFNYLHTARIESGYKTEQHCLHLAKRTI